MLASISDLSSSPVLPLSDLPGSPALSSSTSTRTPDHNEVDTFLRVDSNAVAEVANGGVRSALQKHVDFFDRNNDGKITVGETQEGLVALGIGSVRAWAFATAINAGLGRVTGASWFSPLTIYTDKIAKGKHPSDTDIYTEEGQFSASKFDELFLNYDLDGDNALSEVEFTNFINRNREDEGSSFASKAEFELLMEIAGEEGGSGAGTIRVLSAETLASFYDGSLFYRIAGEPVPA